MEFKNISKDLSVSKTNRDFVISGFASVYELVDYQNDLIAPGAFEVFKDKLLMCLEHNPLHPLGKWFEWSTSDKGFFVKGKILETLPKSKSAIESIYAGTRMGLSIGYEATQTYRRSDGVRIIQKAILYEVSLVGSPANKEALVEKLELHM